MKSNVYKEYIAPVVVLVAICLVVSAALALTYGVANPIIEKNSKANADKARVELLADANGFDRYSGDMATEGKASVTECYTSQNDVGMVCTVETSSFGGALTMMVGINKDGEVTGIKVTDHGDTPGVGTKNWDGDNNVSMYNDLTADDVSAPSVKRSGIQYISGASVTGEALYEGVKAAMAQYAGMQ